EYREHPTDRSRLNDLGHAEHPDAGGEPDGIHRAVRDHNRRALQPRHEYSEHQSIEPGEEQDVRREDGGLADPKESDRPQAGRYQQANYENAPEFPRIRE